MEETLKFVVVSKPGVDQEAYEAWLETVGRVINDLNQLPRHYLVEVKAADAQVLMQIVRQSADTLYVIPADAKIELSNTWYADKPQDPKWHTGRVTKKFPWPFFTPKEANHAGGDAADVYVVDTGVDETHPLFNGKASWLWAYDERHVDDNTHGTHCAGNVSQFAPGASIFAVKVLGANGGGTLEGFLLGLDRVLQAHKESTRPSIATMSLAFVGTVTWLSETICAAIRTLQEAGVIVVAAAGNNAQSLDDIEVFPAEAPDIVTVGATDYTRENAGLIWPDERASFSNYGPAVEIFAPGVQIWSYAPGGGWGCMDGTSMATPIVAAGLARHVTTKLSTLAETKAQIDSFLNAQPKKLVRDARGSSNRFLYLPAA
jgi:subtilisin family serine protease